MKDYIRLFKFAKSYIGLYLVAGVFILISSILGGVSLAMIIPLADRILNNKKIIVPAKLPDFLSNLVDKINAIPSASLLNYAAIIILLLFLIKGLSEFLKTYFISDIGQRVVRDIKAQLFAKFQSLSLEYFVHKRGGELMSRITNDVRIVENAVSYGANDILSEGFNVIFFIGVAFFIYPKMATIIFLIAPLISFSILRVGKSLKKLSRRGQEKMADINSLLYENILGSRIVKAFNMENYEKNKFNKSNEEYYKISIKSIKYMALLGPSTEFLGCLAGIVILLIVGREVMAGKISFGVFGFFIASIFSVIRPFKKLSQVHSINQQGMAAAARIYEVLDASVTVAELAEPIELHGFKNSVVFNNVWFSYGTHEVLKGINLETRKGEVLAVVGPSGAGKTTLLDLIPRFYDPKEGAILIDGIDIKDVSLRSLREIIGIVTQDTILFNDTIKGNIAYGCPDTPIELIEQAAKQANAHDFISRMAQGYDTVIGDRGMKLSGGERQRLAIARALLKNPPILILDEATSQLDSESEHLVQEALDSLMKGRTVFVIAHRLSTVRNASKILVLSGGKITEQGAHIELLGKDGLYKKLYQMQELKNSQS